MQTVIIHSLSLSLCVIRTKFVRRTDDSISCAMILSQLILLNTSTIRKLLRMLSMMFGGGCRVLV